MSRSPATGPEIGDRVAFVTGAGGGLGQAIASRLARQGATVVISDLAMETLAPVLGSLRAQGAACEAIVCDVSDEASVAAAAASVLRLCGRCDVLVNNAAILPPPTRLFETSVALWDKVVAIDLRGPFLCGVHFGQLMRAGGGSIVNISSVAAVLPNSVGAYGVSKAGILALTRQMAVEWGPMGIRANAVSPGFIRTPMSEHTYADPGVLHKRRAAVPLARIGVPQDVAEAVCWLACSESAYVNGQEIVVDGGFLSTALMALQ